MNDIYTGVMDNGGVHINSGIMNKAAYLIATGGIHRGIRVCEGLGRQVLGELYYHALTNHLISSSDFTDMKDAVLDSLHDLYSGDARYNRWRVSITNAFAAVGIGTAEICPLTCWVAPGICPPAPHICTVAPRICPPAPDICRIAPRICPPAPDICRLAPHLCPTAPVAVCKIAPRISCLPGPDPIFDPGIKVLPPDLEIDKIPGITRVHVDALRNLKIKTVSELISSTGSPNKLKKLSQVSEIPTPDLEVLRVEALKLMNP
jgi:thermolysin